MMNIDFDKEREDKERELFRQAQDRERRGVFECEMCGEETSRYINCGNPNCEMTGCSKCFEFDDDLCEYFCGPDCYKERINYDSTKLQLQNMTLTAAVRYVISGNCKEDVREYLREVLKELGINE